MAKIIYSQPNGVLAIVTPTPEAVSYFMADRQAGDGTVIPGLATVDEAIIAIAQKDVPAGTTFEVVADADIPADRTLRDAWEHDTTKAKAKVRINMPKAQIIAHGIRRQRRAAAFAPLDTQVTIPAQAVAAEQARQVIRDTDAANQLAIDGAANETALKLIIDGMVY